MNEQREQKLLIQLEEGDMNNKQAVKSSHLQKKIKT